MTLEEFFNETDVKDNVTLRLPYESEFIIRYLGESKGSFNRIYISSKSRSFMLASAVVQGL
jgi:hypothetical protein